MLGVDHVGHKHNARNQYMDSKLYSISQFLEDLYQNMANDTTLIVFGDHGMTDDGNHGGNSNYETNSVLFSITKGKPFYTDFTRILKSEVKHELDTFHYKSKIIDSKYYKRKVSQIDLTPTVSSILGVSIPFNNLGMVIPEMLGSLDESVQSLIANMEQIWGYLEIIQQK